MYTLCVFMVGAVAIERGQGDVSISGSDFNGNIAEGGGCVFINNNLGLGTGPISFVKSKFKDTTGGMFYGSFFLSYTLGCHGFRPMIALHSYYPLYQNITYYSIMQTKTLTESGCCCCWCWCWCYVCHIWG